jgi:endonuclease-8
MAEGDTIHRLAARMRAVLAGRVPQQIAAPHPRLRAAGWPELLAGREVRRIDAYGKHLFVRFAGEMTLHSHLRMSGAWGVHRRGARWLRSASRAWLVLSTDEFDVVQFDGPVLELLPDARVRRDPRLAALGEDVLGERFDSRRFLRRLREDDPRRAVGEALLDQRNVAGIGNVWKSEACFAAGVDPWRALGDLRDAEAVAIVSWAREQMSAAARAGAGATRRPRAVYRRAGRPCPRCGAPVRGRGQGEDNRITFWCAGCQR